jgi:hypothetical protein
LVKELKLDEYPERAQSTKKRRALGQKRKMRRPQNNTPALIKQPGEIFNKKSQSFKKVYSKS